MWRCCLVSCFAGFVVSQTPADAADLAERLRGVKFDHYAAAPGYSEGPTYREGEVFFCSGALLRVDPQQTVSRYLPLNPAGTVLLGNGHLLIADNRFKAIVDLAPDGIAHVITERHEMEPFRSLNDLTVDARGNIYWTDPEGSTIEKPAGRVYRCRPDGRVDLLTGGLAFPNGLDVDPASRFLYVIESQSKKILRYALPPDDELLGNAELFYDLGGSGGDGCAFDAEGNLWVADFHRPETGTGRITVLSPTGEPLAHLDVPAKVVSNIAFGGKNHDEIFCTTGEPPGVFHAVVGVPGFRGHPGRESAPLRRLNLVPHRPQTDTDVVRKILDLAKTDKLADGEFSKQVLEQLQSEIQNITDTEVREKFSELLPSLKSAVQRAADDQRLLAEVQRLNGRVVQEVYAPAWLREIAGDDALTMFQRITELDLNERTDGHKAPEQKALQDRVTDDWLERLKSQDQLRRLELSGTAVTSAGLVHLKPLVNLERLNLCLTAVDDRGFEHLAGMTKMKRMTICASKITGTGFEHLGGMRQLESINLHSAPASDAGLAAIGKLNSLKRLEIVHTHVTDAGLKSLTGLTNLQQLHIHGPETTTTGLPFLHQLKELYELDVYDQAASNETIAQIVQLPKLRKLMLVIGRFDDAGVQRFCELTTLENLTLNSPNVTDAAVEPLSRLKKLRTLEIGGTKISAAGRQKLAAALPRTVITP